MSQPASLMAVALALAVAADAAAADAAQYDPEVRAFRGRSAPAQRHGRSGSKQSMRQCVEFAGNPFEHIGKAIDDCSQQIGKEPGTGERHAVGSDVALECAKRRQLGEPHRDQPVASQHEPDRSCVRIIGVGIVDEWCAQIERPISGAQPARRFDFAELLQGRHFEAGCSFDERNLAGLGLQQVNPHGVRCQPRIGDPQISAPQISASGGPFAANPVAVV